MTKLVLHLEPKNLKYLLGFLDKAENGVSLPSKSSMIRELIVTLTEHTNTLRSKTPEGLKKLDVWIPETHRSLPLDNRFRHIHIPPRKMDTLNRLIDGTMRHELNLMIQVGSSVGSGTRQMIEIIDQFFETYGLTEQDWSYDAVKKQNFRFRNSGKQASLLN